MKGLKSKNLCGSQDAISGIMKKIAILIIGVLLAGGLAAQSHSFRDTSYVRYEQFDYDSWVWKDTNHHGKWYHQPVMPTLPYYGSCLMNDDILQYNYTDDSAGMEVVGLSAAVFFDQLRSTARPEYLLLYEARPDTFELKGQLQWDETDTAGRPDGRWLVNYTDCGDIWPGAPGMVDFSYDNTKLIGIKIFDLYFDTTIVVYDSFYVGGTSHFEQIGGTYSSSQNSRCHYLTFAPHLFNYIKDDTCTIPTLWKLYHYDPPYTPLNEWYWVQSNQFLMILPIIRVVDTTFAHVPECPRVSGLFARGNYTDTVTVQWAQDSLHTEFELSYGREGIAAEDGTIVTVNGNRWQFTDTAYNDIPMVAYVRTVCREYDTLRWSGWSSVRWRLHHEVADTSHSDTTQTEGIVVPEEGDDLTRYVRLMPNPASGNVVVMSSYGIESVEVYDVRGERVAELTGVGRERTAGFDVSRWAKGAYVVLVRTPMGTASKRLVVN